MKAVNREQLLRNLEDTVERHIQEAVSIYQNLPESDLIKPAANGGWSIVQCLAHLNSYGDYYLPRIKTGIDCQKGIPVDTLFRSSCIGKLLINSMDTSEGFRKYRAIAAHLPSANPDAYAVVREFIRQQEELLLLLRTCQSIDLYCMQIPASVLSGVYLKLGDALQFLVAHTQRHLAQARKNISVIA